MTAALERLCAEAKEIMERVAPLSDLVIVSGDGDEFAVAKAMLAAVSVMLANMFADVKGDKAKTRHASAADNKVVFQDTSEEVVMLLNHAYGETHFQVDSLKLKPCLKMAQKYDMPRLLDACHDYLDKLNLGDNNAAGWLREAPSYKLPRFTRRCVEYAAGHLQSIIDNRVGKQLPPTDWLEKLPPKTLVEILQSRSRILGSFDSGYLRDRPSTDQELVQLEKRPRNF